MKKKHIITAVSIYIVVALVAFSGINFWPLFAAPPSGIGQFAPDDAFYVLVQQHNSLTNGVLTTALTHHLIAGITGLDIGSATTPWNNIFGILGSFSQLVANTLSSVSSLTLSSGGTNQNIFLQPSGTGKVKIGGNSVVVQSLVADPSIGSSEAGQVYFNTTTQEFRAFDGTWKTLGINTPASNVIYKVLGQSGVVCGTSTVNPSGSSFTVPANLLGVDKGLKISGVINITANGADDNIRFKLTLGGAELFERYFYGDRGDITHGTYPFETVIYNKNNTNAQVSFSSLQLADYAPYPQFAGQGIISRPISVDTNVNQTIILECEDFNPGIAGDNDVVNLEMMIVELLP